MTSRVARALGSERVVYAACAASLGIGLFFVFVWAPHPWGWQGFDHYHEIALEVASGRPFPTLEIGFAWSDPDAAIADAKSHIDRFKHRWSDPDHPRASAA